MMPKSRATAKVDTMVKVRGVVVKYKTSTFGAAEGRGGISWGEAKAKATKRTDSSGRQFERVFRGDNEQGTRSMRVREGHEPSFILERSKVISEI